MSEAIKNNVGKGAIFLYIETISAMVSGYLFWIIMSQIASATVIGQSSTIISLSIILAVIANLGLPSGIMRFLGKTFSDRNTLDSRTYTIVSGSVVIAASTITCIFTYFVYRFFNIDGFDDVFILLVIILTFSYSLSTLLRAIIISTLKTRVVATAMVVSSATKILVATLLVLLGLGAIGIVSGMIINQFILMIILGFAAYEYLRHKLGVSSITVSECFKQLVPAGVVFWVPFLITTLGVQLAPIVVYGNLGAEEAGLFFMALTIVTGITNVAYSLSTVALPAMSAMKEKREEFSWHIIRMSTIITIPFTVGVLYYSSEILSLLGQAYIQAATALEIMLLSVLPALVHFGFTSLAFSYGSNRIVLLLGLSISIPRILLYLILVPIFGNDGAALSYTIGSALGLGIGVFLVRGFRLPMDWKYITLLFVIPMAVGYLISIFSIYPVFGFIMIICLSYIAYFKIGILSRTDIHDILRLLPPSVSRRTIPILNTIYKKLKL